ncbi:MAG: hypothetical protein K8S97_11950 [Anaerolineae bacterium]|nr:hypothetical protein [Anaerolineae bacterium]
MIRKLMLFALVLSLCRAPFPNAVRSQDDPGCIDRTDPTLVVQPPELPLPEAGVPFTDPVFCTTLRRVSNASASGDFETHEYSQLQAFSADNAYVLLLAGDAGTIVRRVDDLSVVEGLDTGTWNAARWYPPEPHTLLHFDSNADTTLRVQLTHVDTLQTETIYTFPPEYERVIVNASSDELSDDGAWLGGIAQRADGEWVIFALDIANRTLGAQLAINELYADACTPDPEWGNVTPDWVGVSPLGRYLVVQWQRDGTARCSGLETFDPRTGDFVGRVYDGHQHGDLGVTADGDEFFMTFEMYHPSGDLSIGVRALPGNAEVSAPEYVNVLAWGNGAHISCQGPPGVCLVTASTLPDNGWNPFEAEIFLQYVDGRVERLAHHHSTECGYWVQPRASLSGDGRYAIFASDWGHPQACDDLGRGDPYIIEIPEEE